MLLVKFNLVIINIIKCSCEFKLFNKKVYKMFIGIIEIANRKVKFM